MGQKIFFLLLVSFLSSVGAFAYDKLTEPEIHSLYSKLENNFPNNKDIFTSDEMNKVFRDAKNHPVASLSVLSHYDKTGAIGFCFGRAMTTHFLSRETGLRAPSIVKMFVIGDLRQRGATKTEWRFHVTTLVKGSDHWYAIDPIMPSVLTSNQWIQRVSEGWDSWEDPQRPNRKKAIFYIVSPQAIMPDLRSFKLNPKDEKGDEIIDLNFNPKKRGLTRIQLDRSPVYLLDSNQKNIARADFDLTDLFFMSATEKDNDRFNFEELVISKEKYNFNNYFSHLLQTFLHQNRIPNDGRSADPLSDPEWEKNLPSKPPEDNVLGSPKLSELIK